MNRYKVIEAQILSRLDIQAEAEVLGVKFAASEPGPSGWLSCHAIDREDNNPSAAICVDSSNPAAGWYKDHGGGGKKISFFDLAAELGSFDDWREARAHYAEKAGVTTEPISKAKKKSIRKPKTKSASKVKKKNAPASKAKSSQQHEVNPAKDLQFKDWSPNLVPHFLNAKPGITEQGMLEAGGQFAVYKKIYSVFAFPIFGPTLDLDKPVGWTIYQFNGKQLPVWNREGQIVGHRKCKNTYGSESGFMNRYAIERLRSPGMVETVIKFEGVTDMLTAQSMARPDNTVCVTNPFGAMETPKWQTSLLADYNVLVVADHDEDGTGVAGAKKWGYAVAALQECDKQTRVLCPPAGVMGLGAG